MKTKRLQNYKRCVGCHADYDLSVEISQCEICGSKKFVPCTTYQTIDDVCNQPPGSFKKFIERENEKLREIERERKERIAQHRKLV